MLLYCSRAIQHSIQTQLTSSLAPAATPKPRKVQESPMRVSVVLLLGSGETQNKKAFTRSRGVALLTRMRRLQCSWHCGTTMRGGGATTKDKRRRYRKNLKLFTFTNGTKYPFRGLTHPHRPAVCLRSTLVVCYRRERGRESQEYCDTDSRTPKRNRIESFLSPYDFFFDPI
jgi:hypothetical protein